MPTCTIVGAGPGLSSAVARRFASSGYAVGLIARTAAHVRPLAAELARPHGAAWTCADAGDPAALLGALSALGAEIGPPDVLVYNASVMRPEGPLEVDVETVRAELDVNVIGALAAAQHVAPAMRARGRGAILFTGGGLAREPYPEWTSLALGKAALRSLSFSLFKELSPHGVHVGVIAVCGIVEPGGPFDPDLVAREYWRLATAPRGLEDREVFFQPEGTDAFYNDPGRVHRDTTPAIHR